MSTSSWRCGYSPGEQVEGRAGGVDGAGKRGGCASKSEQDVREGDHYGCRRMFLLLLLTIRSCLMIFYFSGIRAPYIPFTVL